MRPVAAAVVIRADECGTAHRVLGFGGVIELDRSQRSGERRDLTDVAELELGQLPDPDAATVRGPRSRRAQPDDGRPTGPGPGGAGSTGDTPRRSGGSPPKKGGARPLRAIVDFDEAVVCLRAGALDDAARLRTAALYQFEELGMVGWVTRAGQLRVRAQERVHRR